MSTFLSFLGGFFLVVVLLVVAFLLWVRSKAKKGLPALALITLAAELEVLKVLLNKPENAGDPELSALVERMEGALTRAKVAFEGERPEEVLPIVEPVMREYRTFRSTHPAVHDHLSVVVDGDNVSIKGELTAAEAVVETVPAASKEPTETKPE